MGPVKTFALLSLTPGLFLRHLTGPGRARQGGTMNVERTLAAAALAARFVVGGIVVAANEPKPPTQEEMMAAWQKAAAPGPEHKVLENYLGHWTAKVTSMMNPTAPPEVTEG